MDVDPYLFPARGRKRHMYKYTKEQILRSSVDPYLFPARGRKRRISSFVNITDLVDPYLFPARGRKLLLNSLEDFIYIALIPTFSPQGDGN